MYRVRGCLEMGVVHMDLRVVRSYELAAGCHLDHWSSTRSSAGMDGWIGLRCVAYFCMRADGRNLLHESCELFLWRAVIS